MAIKVRNEQLEGTKWKKQNNVLRMILFYSTCGLVVFLVSYGGLFMTKSNLKSGVASADVETLESAINFTKVNRTLKSQMPGILDAGKPAASDSKYMSSADIKYEGPVLVATPENIASLLEKGGLITKSADGEVDYSNLDTSLETMGYSRIFVKVVNEKDSDAWLNMTIQKDESLLHWRVTGVTMSPTVKERVLK